MTGFTSFDPGATLGSGTTLSGGNRTATRTDGLSSPDTGAKGLVADAQRSGKFYVEYATSATGGGDYGYGACLTSATYPGLGSNAASGVICFGNIWNNGGFTGKNAGSPITSRTAAAMAIDLTNKRAWFRLSSAINWNNDGTADPAANVGGVDISAWATGLVDVIPVVVLNNNSSQFVVNFGQSAFAGPVPTGFVGWPGSLLLPTSRGLIVG